MKLLKVVILSLIFCAAPFLVSAQPNVTGGVQIYIDRGDDYFKSYQYDRAIEQYEKALKYDKSNDAVKLKIANSYRLSFDDKKAEEWYAKVINNEKIITTKDKLYYAQALKKNGKYEEAKKWYKAYLHEARDDHMARSQLYSITHADQFYRDTLKYVISNVHWNSINDEYAPFLLREKLYFTSDRSERSTVKVGKHAEIFVANVNDSIDADPLIKHYPYDFDMGAFALYDNGNKLIFTRTISTKTSDPDNNKLKLYEFTWDEAKKEWGNLNEIKVADVGQVAAQPAITSDGNMLVFVSDSTNRSDGQGGADMYVSYRAASGEWSKPKNLGPGVNTNGREHYPYFANDTVLYFSSTGHPGLGGMDIFRMPLSGPDSGKVINMGYPINSTFDDYGITFSEDYKYGYFGSNRDGGKGRDDLYRIDLKKVRKIILEGFTKDISDSPINMGKVVIYDNITKEQLGGSDENGYFRLELDDEKNYELVAKALSKPQFFEIHFEGFIKDDKDSSHLVELNIIDPVTKKKVSREMKNGYLTFGLEEGREYKLDVDVSQAPGIELSDVHFQGFVTDNTFPHINLGEVHILNAMNNRMLFKSDPSGFFNFQVKENEHLLVKAFRKSPEDFFELSFEGFVKNRKDTTDLVELIVIDPETNQPVAKNTDGGFLNFVLENGKDYKFKANLNDTANLEMSDIHFEGFVKDIGIPIIIGEVQMKEWETDEEIFRSNEKGFFNFKMEHNKEYDLKVIKKRDPKHNFIIWLEGFVKNEEDTSKKALIKLYDPENPDQLIFKSGNDGFFAFSLKEDFVYKALASLLTDSARVKFIEKLKFEGFASDPEVPVMAGKVNIYNAENDTILAESDMFGYFSLELDPKQKYKFVAKKDPPGADGERVPIVFKGFVKDQDDSLTFANLTIIDPETGKEVVKSDLEGYFSFELEEGKVYEVVATPTADKQGVISNARLVLIEEKEVIEQVFLIDNTSGKYFELIFGEGSPYYTDGVLVHHIGDEHSGDSVTIHSIRSLLSSSGISISDTTVLHSIFYGTNSIQLGQKEKDNLDRIAKLMKANKDMKVLVSSYADQRGTVEYNKELARRRNNSVITYITRKGVNTNRIKAIAYGEFEGLKHCKNCKEEELSKDRRTDFIIISY